MTSLLLLGVLATACGSKADRIGHERTGIYVECDPRGFTVKNEGDRPRYLDITGFCTLNTKQVPGIGRHGEFPDRVLHGSQVPEPKNFTTTVPVGGTARHDLDLPQVPHCMDTTDAPPGSTGREPVSLISQGPADAIHMYLHIYEVGVVEGEQDYVHLACRW